MSSGGLALRNLAMTSSQRNIAVLIITRFVVCAAILGFGFLAAYILIRTRPMPITSNQGDIGPRVRVLELEAKPIAERWTAYGTVLAVDSADVPARVLAIVDTIPEKIRDGAPVEAGDVLVILDAMDYQEQLTMSHQRLAQVDAQIDRLEIEAKLARDRLNLAERDVELAEADLQRVRDAFEAGAAVTREIDLVEQRLLKSQHTVIAQREVLDQLPVVQVELKSKRVAEEAAGNMAALNVERCTIRSPITGVLASVDLEVGESVRPGQRIARVVNVEQLEIPLHVAASARADISLGDEVRISRPGSTSTLSAPIQRISPVDDQQTRTLAVYVEVDSQDSGLAPGLFVRGEIISSSTDERIIVPRRSIRNQRVMLVEDGRIQLRRINTAFNYRGERPETGLPDLEWVVLEDRLPDASLLVVDGARALGEGMLVDAIPVVRERTAGTSP